MPHASTAIPDEFRGAILVDEGTLALEVLRMTDWHTVQLFDGLRELGATLFVNELSRLVVDPERFVDDADEPSSSTGQGAVYTRTSDGAELRRGAPEERQELLDRVYEPYHQGLTDLVAGLLAEFDRCLLVDCHSFSSVPLASEADKRPERPDICIGTDRFHTPAALSSSLKAAFVEEGFRVERNRPFSGALVPMRYYGRDRRVTAVMIEVRRDLYCQEASGQALPQLGPIRRAIQRAVAAAI